jgi:hypothetical protein
VAVRKDTIKQLFIEALPPVLEPGEQVLGGAYGVSGPNPLWAQGLLGLAGFLIFGMRYYYVALTDRRLIFLNASFWTSRPKGFAWADPRDSITISDLQTDNKLWNWGKISSRPNRTSSRTSTRSGAPELKAMGDMRPTDRRSAPGPSGRGSGSGGWPAPSALTPPPALVAPAAGLRVERSARPLLPGAVPGCSSVR